MKGTIFWNSWFAIISFTFYFMLSFHPDYPNKIIMESLIYAFLSFIFMYLIRWSLSSIMDNNSTEKHDHNPNSVENAVQESLTDKSRTDESEQIAAIVKKMMAEEQR
ncbi:hypothetical protein [Rossellomorea aquimaris]|uniref:hypothetical protein n=1 Tax=Rossellomorea aquimaris TaxID=189382 RepID=UPI0012E83B04|nr:hypothetical protein [Rossellomorea aquimaris]